MNSTSMHPSPDDAEMAHFDGPETADAADAADAADDAGVGASLSRDELFHLLQNSRRRAVLRYLRGREGPVRMRDVAEQVAAWEHDTTVAQLSSDERQRVYIALYQSHLETLEEAGVIQYNKPRGVVQPEPLLDRVASFLDPDWPAGGDEGEVDAGGDEWDRGYLGVAVAGSILLAGTALDVSVLGAMSNFVIATVILTAFTLLTLAKLALERNGPMPTERR